MSRVLVVEDDAPLARGLLDNLRFDGHEAIHAASAEEGMERLASEGADLPDLLLLDLMLPGKSGFDLLRWIQERGLALRVIVVSARDAEADVVRALDLGAKDYVKKPFGLSELLARVRAQLREVEASSEDDGDRTFGDVRVSLRRFRLWKGDDEHLLTHLEVGMLRLFFEREDQPLKRVDIIDGAWGTDAYPSERTVDNFILKLRKKIEDDPSAPRFLVTVHGHGYRFTTVPV